MNIQFKIMAISMLLAASAFTACGSSGNNETPGDDGITFSITSHFAGSTGGAGSADGTGAAAEFNKPYSVCSDGTNLYVSDYNNNTIRKIVIATGEVTTIAGSPGLSGLVNETGSAARFYSPRGLAFHAGNLYVVDASNSAIRKIDLSTGAVTTFAGGIYGTNDGTGTAAQFMYPTGIVYDDGNLYVADEHRIRKIVIASAVVTAFAGDTTNGYNDATGIAARFNRISDIAVNAGNLYVTDSNNYKIRKIVISSADVTTFAGSTYGHVNEPGIAAKFFGPSGITSDGTDLYITDNNNEIRKIAISGAVVTTIAGDWNMLGFADGTGTDALFNSSLGIVNVGENLYVADCDNNLIRKIVKSSAAVTTFAGTPALTGTADGTGSNARFTAPAGVISDGTYLYVADTIPVSGADPDYSTIRKIEIATGAVTTFAGSAHASGTTDGTGTGATFNTIKGITKEGNYLYVTDVWEEEMMGVRGSTIRRIDLTNSEVTTIAGDAGLTGTTDGTGADARFSSLGGITSDGTYLYVTDTIPEMHDLLGSTIRRIEIATAVVTTFAGSASAAGTTDGTGSAARFNSTKDITKAGNYLYVTDMGGDTNFILGSTIRKIDITTAAVTTFAGSATLTGSTDDSGTAARFKGPRGITSDGTSLYIADTGNQTIRKIVISTGAVSTIAGTAGKFGWSDDLGLFNTPRGIVFTGTSLFVTESSRIRKID